MYRHLMFDLFFGKGAHLGTIGQEEFDAILNRGVARAMGWFADACTLGGIAAFYTGHSFIGIAVTTIAVRSAMESDQLHQTVQKYEIKRLLEDIHES